MDENTQQTDIPESIVFGTQEQFEEKYGKTVDDGTPRFGEDYSYLHHKNELTLKDRFLSLFLN